MESEGNELWRKHILPDLSHCKDKRVIIRVDWNMPIVNDKIADTSRFDISVPFLKKMAFAGAKIIILTHFGEQGESLKPIAAHVTKMLPFIKFTPSLDFDELGKEIGGLSSGDGILLENVRLWRGETENLPSLGRSFASLGDIFINDAFSVSHREHASTVGIARNVLSYFGPEFVRELEHLTRALHPTRPSLLIIGGAKIATKLPLIEQYLDQGVEVFVGGAMVHDIWAARGIAIGKSLYDPSVKLSPTMFNHPLLLTPLDVVIETRETLPYTEIPSNGMVVDCGPKTIEMLTQKIRAAKTIIVNGPLGLYEKGWRYGSEQILQRLADSNVESYIGGGDTVALAHSLHLLRQFTFVSLGGGAMLQFLASGTLPGIDAVTEQQLAG